MVERSVKAYEEVIHILGASGPEEILAKMNERTSMVYALAAARIICAKWRDHVKFYHQDAESADATRVMRMIDNALGAGNADKKDVGATS